MLVNVWMLACVHQFVTVFASTSATSWRCNCIWRSKSAAVKRPHHLLLLRHDHLHVPPNALRGPIRQGSHPRPRRVLAVAVREVVGQEVAVREREVAVREREVEVREREVVVVPEGEGEWA